MLMHSSPCMAWLATETSSCTQIGRGVDENLLEEHFQEAQITETNNQIGLINETPPNTARILSDSDYEDENLLEEHFQEEFNSNFQKEAKSIENWERENLKAEKRKRDLKMKKITSPCNCKTRKNKGRTLCKHQGNIFGKTYVIERNHGDSSDSELCIRRSNKRLTDASMEESSTFDDPDHTFAIGEKIGIDWLCSQDEPMKIPQGNGDKIPPC
ncbi:hypothetical protein LXL04_033031 [Taraxacum kok-saghyz]